jgi:hypothetical protein
LIDPPVAGAWIDPSIGDAGTTTNYGSVSAGRYPSGASCDNWIDSSANYFGYWITAQSVVTNSGSCTATRPLACCNGAPKTQFAGYTNAVTTGNPGGRVKLHQLCNTEFPGSHFCHATEYIRANVTAAPPAIGAWIDPSSGSGTSTNAGVPTMGRYLGGASCNAWTDGTANYFAYWISPQGTISNSGACTSSRSVACCM